MKVILAYTAAAAVFSGLAMPWWQIGAAMGLLLVMFIRMRYWDL